MNNKKITINVAWLFFDKIFRMGLSLVVGAWFARYIGVESFGLYNYIIAIFSIFSSVATLGVGNIAVREIIRHPEKSDEIMGVAFWMHFFGGIIAFILGVVFLYATKDKNILVYGLIFGSLFLIKVFDTIKYWYESRVESKYIVIAENLSSVVFSGVKILLILNLAGLFSFFMSVIFEAALVAIIMCIFFFKKEGKIVPHNFNLPLFKNLLRDSWPLIFSGVAAMIYMRIDQILIGNLMGDKSVGVYSAALRLSEIWYFVPMIVTSSVFPKILLKRENNIEEYNNNFQDLCRYLFYIAFAFAIFVTISAEEIIRIIYGVEYIESAGVLIVHVWSGVFVFLGVAGGRWLIAENLQKYTFYRTMAGCVISVALNIILIPIYGVVGSAFASVISQAVASVFFNALNFKTRPIFIMQIKAMLFLDIKFNTIK